MKIKSIFLRKPQEHAEKSIASHFFYPCRKKTNTKCYCISLQLKKAIRSTVLYMHQLDYMKKFPETNTLLQMVTNLYECSQYFVQNIE